VGVGVRMMLGWISEKGWEDVNWMHLARDSVHWWAVVSLRVPYRAGGFLVLLFAS
jgi:hypothetical protein